MAEVCQTTFLTCRLNSLGLEIFWHALGRGELPPESCALERRGDMDSGEDKFLISSSFDGIVIVRVGVDFFDDASEFLAPPLATRIVASVSDMTRISGLPRFTCH